MKNFRIIIGIMMFVLVTFFISSVVSKQANALIIPPELINDSLNLDNVTVSYDSPFCGGTPSGTFTISATFTNNTTNIFLSGLFFEVDTLTEGNMLCNADGGAGGAGSILTVTSADLGGDGVLNPAESFTQDFDIGLASFSPFQFFVDAYGEPFVCGEVPLEDTDGNMYDTVMIGTQCWMAENLNVGNRIDGVVEMADNGTTEKYCYNNDTDNCGTDGGLYQWNEMMQYSTTEGVQGICPDGWHIPTDTEWKTLEMELGMTQAQADGLLWRGTDQGTQLKTGGTSGFDALLAGNRTSDGLFNLRGSAAFFWSSTESGSSAWDRYLSSNEARVYRKTNNKANGFSVRCVKD